MKTVKQIRKALSSSSKLQKRLERAEGQANKPTTTTETDRAANSATQTMYNGGAL